MQQAVYVLLVDDNSPDDRASITAELSREGPHVRVVAVSDRSEFDAEIASGKFDLVITDYSLGWISGLEIIRSIKASRTDCPVIMFTANDNASAAVEAMKAGLDDYVIKSAD